MSGFFDFYSSFLSTSHTGSSLNRLNARYDAIIGNNRSIFNGARVLDIASHDGRWSFAALKANSSHVLGIEGRDYLVENAKSHMINHGVDKSRYTFRQGDINREIMNIPSGSLDVILCLGYFYHTMHHQLLLSEIKRIAPKYLIMDTNISTNPSPIIELRVEDAKEEHASIKTQDYVNHSALVGNPSRKAMELMLKHTGFKFKFYPWLKSGIKNWKGLEDYKQGKRVTIFCEL